MECNGYVKVQFVQFGKVYTYMIPDYIDYDSVQNWVIVEDMFYKDRPKNDNASPYKICKVVDKCKNWETWRPSASKYIAAAIDTRKYIYVRDYDKMRDEIVDGLYDELEENLDLNGIIDVAAWLTYCPNKEVADIAENFLNKKEKLVTRMVQNG